MALVTKMTRCAVCGSSDVSFDGKTYHCATCGTDSDAVSYTHLTLPTKA